MKAAILKEFGSPLALESLPDPTPAAATSTMTSPVPSSGGPRRSIQGDRHPAVTGPRAAKIISPSERAPPPAVIEALGGDLGG
jgi:hypothetical protein